ncbi:uncharacterized protein LOC143375379 [Andrena cerasifolii]|uniref:uncharacterized protein LOC143375379 n=1 Tax=Andrena cerasifolii TaxID=2819439 RepID=UPI004038165F
MAERDSRFNTRGHSARDNVGGLHELQGRELCRHGAAVRLGFRRRDRKRVLRVRRLLHQHQARASTGESVVRVWQGHRELASTGESRQTLKSILLALLSSVLSKSTTKHEPPQSTNAEDPTMDSPRSSSPMCRVEVNRETEEDSESLETLFIPEDPNEYAEISLQARQALGRGEESTSLLDREALDDATQRGGGTTRRELADEGTVLSGETRENVENTGGEKLAPGASSKTVEDTFFKLGGSVEAEGSSSLLEEEYSPRNPGGASSGTTLGSNRGTEVAAAVESSGGKLGDEGKLEPDEEDVLEAANFGLEAMKNLYSVKEPTLYSMGLYLDTDNPARYVAAFNDQTEEARALAKYGFAVLQGTAMFKKKFPDATTDFLLSRRSQSNPLRRHCPNRGVPDCPAASFRYRTSDGSCNNFQHLWWGSAMSPMQRFLPSVYDDGVQSVRRSVSRRPLPSARLVTSVIHEDRDVPLASVTHMLMQWGQFVDHDVTATGQSRGFNGTIPQCCLKFGTGFQPPELMHPECLPIAVSAQDSFFGPLGVKCLEFLRSGPAPREDCEFGPREQLSQVTSYLDASTVYSSNAFQTDTLRLFRNGLLQYGKLESQRPLLPRLNADLCRRGSLSTSCFRAGDGRLGEQPALTSLHVVFLRLHNRIATKLAGLNPHWSDEKLFQESRRIVGALVQHITYREFLPIVLGQDVMKIFGLEVQRKGYYEGYDPNVNPTVANGFATAAYRFGHSLVQHSFVRFDSDHQPIFNNVTIHKEFSNPANLETAGSVDRLLLGLINQPSQRRDEHIAEELTNHLFQTPSFPFGMDLASINIQRGRDHGVPPYVQWREPCGLSPVRSFKDLERLLAPSAAWKFKLVYPSVEDVDLFTAGLAEKSVSGGLVGPTFACIIGQQFSNLRRGDRFWYENPGQESSFTPGQLQQIRRVSLAQVLCSTMDDIDTVQPFVFLAPDNLRNRRLPCDDPAIGQLDLEFWAERPSKLRSRAGILDILKKKPKVTTAKPTTQERISPISVNIAPQKTPPLKGSIHQQNRVVVKKPLGPPDNFTIVVQNNAVNSPIFVNDAVYGSNLGGDPLGNQQAQINPSRPIFDVISNRPFQHGPLQSIPMYVPLKPIPTSPPSLPNALAGQPYVPYAFNDPSNPNPLSQGYQSSYGPSDVLFESYSASTPRPTLYTYYTSFQRPSTQRPPHDVDAYLVNYRPSPWSSLESQQQTGGQLPRPHYDAPGNQQPHSGSSYEAANWQKLQQQHDFVNQPSGQGHWSSQGYGHRPSSPHPADRGSQNNIHEIRPSALPSYQILDKPYDQHSIGPLHQPTRRPITPTYQKESDRPDIHQPADYNAALTGRPFPNTVDYGVSVNSDTLYSKSPSSPAEEFKRPSRPYSDPAPIYRPVQDVPKRDQSWQATIAPHKDQLDKLDSGSYQSLARPTPTKVHSVTIVTEAGGSGYKVDGIGDRVTGEVPKPLVPQVNDNRQVIRRPGQYYYEKNVLHRYPDKIEDQAAVHGHGLAGSDAEQRHKAAGGGESIGERVIDRSEGSTQVIDGDENGSDVAGTTSRTRNVTGGSERDDDADHSLAGAFAEEIESITSTDRTIYWLNPQEDTSLPSALELPKVPSDAAAAASELPKPIKCRSYAS